MANVTHIYGNEVTDAAARGSLAPAYSASSTYAVGDLVLHEGQLYECSTAISTAEAWTAAHWTAKTVADEVTDLKGGLTDLNEDITQLQTDLMDILVENTSGTVTLTNIENAQSFYNGVGASSSTGVSKVSYSDGIAKFSARGGDQLSPYIRNLPSSSWGTKKWICGFKYRLTKASQSLGNPEKIRVYLGSSLSYDNFNIVWDHWVDFAEVASTDLTRIMLIVANFATAPTENSFTCEFKDFYLYDATDVDSDMCSYIISQQSSNYQDGTVTYGTAITDYAPDTTLTEEGKCADSKAVGDAIGTPVYNVKNFGAKGDGTTDDTLALQALFASKSGRFYFPTGTYKINGTLSIPASSEMFGDGDSTIISVYGYTNLDYRYFRGNTKVYPYILVENAFVKLHDFKIVGSTPEHKTHYGIGVIDTTHCEIKNVTAYNINYDPNRQESDAEYASAYGIAALRSGYVTIDSCYVENCGYECIGIADASHNCVVKNCVTKNGWRTCMQVHRGAYDVEIIGNQMIQDAQAWDACFTLHGLSGDDLVRNLRLADNTFEASVSPRTRTEDYAAVVQLMSYCDGLWFINNRVVDGDRDLYADSSVTHLYIMGNLFEADDTSDYRLKINSANAVIVGNVLENTSGTTQTIPASAALSGNIGIS